MLLVTACPKQTIRWPSFAELCSQYATGHKDHGMPIPQPGVSQLPTMQRILTLKLMNQAVAARTHTCSSCNMQVLQCAVALRGWYYTQVQQRTKWSALWSLRCFDCFQHDHWEEHANLCLEGMSEFGHQGEKDAAGKGKSLGNGGGAILQQTEAQVLLDSGAELLACSEHFSAVLKQDHQQLKGQNLHEATSHDMTLTHSTVLPWTSCQDAQLQSLRLQPNQRPALHKASYVHASADNLSAEHSR